MGQRESTRVGSVAATLVLFYGALQRETGRKTSRGTEIGYQFHDITSTCIGKRQKSPAKWRWLLWQGRTLESLAVQRSSVKLTCEWGRWERNLNIHFAKKKRISPCCGPVASGRQTHRRTGAKSSFQPIRSMGRFDS